MVRITSRSLQTDFRKFDRDISLKTYLACPHQVIAQCYEKKTIVGEQSSDEAHRVDH